MFNTLRPGQLPADGLAARSWRQSPLDKLPPFDRRIFERVSHVEVDDETRNFLTSDPALVAKLLRLQGIPQLPSDKEEVAFRTSFELLAFLTETAQDPTDYFRRIKSEEAAIELYYHHEPPLAGDFSDEERQTIARFANSAFVVAVREVIPFTVVEPVDVSSEVL